jgi:Outer membrane protein beta-barrel domain
MKKYSQIQKIVSVLMIFLLLMQLSGCYSTKIISSSTLPIADSIKCSYTVHCHNSNYMLEKVIISNGILSGKIDTTGNYYIKNRVHIYLLSDSVMKINTGYILSIPLDGIEKVEKASESFAQTFGIIAGYNLSNLTDIEPPYNGNQHRGVEEYKMKSGFNAGVTVEFPTKDWFSIDMGLILSTKGSKTSQQNSSYQPPSGSKTTNITGTRNLVYLDIPLTIKAYSNAGYAKIYGAFGPYIGIGLGGKWNTIETNNLNGGAYSSSSNSFDNLNKLDFGLTAGAGVSIYSFQIGLSYGYGLSNISSYSPVIIRNRVLGISVGYIFGGK